MRRTISSIGVEWLALVAIALLGPAIANVAAADQTAGASERVRLKAVRILRTALTTEQRWIKVHAAEALLSLGYPENVAATFERELSANGAEPQYRIGIWRVLAQAARTKEQRDSWTGKIAAAFLDADGPDRLHASETLGKLGYRAGGNELDAFDLVARTGPGPFAANARWVLVNSGRPGSEMRLAELLESGEPGARANAAYAIRHLRRLSPAAWNTLIAAAGREAGDEIVRVSLVSSAFVHAPVDQRARLKTDLLNYARSRSNDVKYEVCAALAMSGDRDDLPLLTRLLDDPNADVRIGAAYAALRAGLRAPRRVE